MDLFNNSPVVLDAHQAMDKVGQRYLVALAKATYAFPADEYSFPTLAETQTPIFAADVFEGEPGHSTIFFECNYGLRKGLCDVILKATAYAPDAIPVKELFAGFQIGNCQKAVRIVGDRTWEGLFNLSPSRPAPFTQMPLTYSRAFGGSIPPLNEKDSGLSHPANPIGCGYAKGKYTSQLKGTAVPNLESPDQPISRCSANYKPCSFGPIGRSWQPRLPLAGTYDEAWKENVFPLLPADFDEAFFQCAPKDQQIPFPVGGETITLINMHPTRARVAFVLPDLELPMVLLTQQRSQHKLEPKVDCITIDADQQQFTILWRAHFPIKRAMDEIHTLGIGKISRCKWRPLVMGIGDCSGETITADTDDIMDITDAMDNCSDCGLTT
jgi:hypothetical protein